MKVLFLIFSLGYFVPMASEDSCTARITDGTNTVSCTAETCAAARACAIAGWEAIQ